MLAASLYFTYRLLSLTCLSCYQVETVREKERAAEERRTCQSRIATLAAPPSGRGRDGTAWQFSMQGGRTAQLSHLAGPPLPSATFLLVPAHRGCLAAQAPSCGWCGGISGAPPHPCSPWLLTTLCPRAGPCSAYLRAALCQPLVPCPWKDLPPHPEVWAAHECSVRAGWGLSSQVQVPLGHPTPALLLCGC